MTEPTQWCRQRLITTLAPNGKQVLVTEERLQSRSIDLEENGSETRNGLRYRLPDGSPVTPLDDQGHAFEIDRTGVRLAVITA